MAPRGGSDAQVNGACAVCGGTLFGAVDDRSGAVEGAAQRDGFADEEAQAYGVLGEKLREAARVCFGQ